MVNVSLKRACLVGHPIKHALLRLLKLSVTHLMIVIVSYKFFEFLICQAQPAPIAEINAVLNMTV